MAIRLVQFVPHPERRPVLPLEEKSNFLRARKALRIRAWLERGHGPKLIEQTESVVLTDGTMLHGAV